MKNSKQEAGKSNQVFWE
jgi:hypothetical protein